MKALAAFLLTLLFVFVAARSLVRALPGDPIDTILAESGTSVAPAEIRADLGLDRPWAHALAHDLGRALRGDLGVSIFSRKPIAALIAPRLARSLELAALALALGIAASLFLGLSAAAAPGARVDRFCTAYGAIAAALPTPWLGPILLYLLAYRVPIFRLGGSVWLPALTVALGFSGLWSRLVRARARESLAWGAARGARARGLPEWKVLLKYGLAPSSGALAAYLGTQTGWLLGGAMVSEVIFDWPGLGELLVQSVLRRDYPVVEWTSCLVAALSLSGTRAGDWARGLLDGKARNS